MREIKVLGTGCAKCDALEKNVREAIADMEQNFNVVKVTDITEIVALGVMATPALVVDGKAVSSGKALKPDEIKKILNGYAEAAEPMVKAAAEYKHKEDLDMSENCCCSGGGCDEPKIKPVSTSLSMGDIWGACKARWGIGRMDYKVKPGLYSVGNPDNNSPVLVSANYKLTFDTLRKNLRDLDCWLLILDTKGVNVWCAAGKGTFGTEELINRIEKSQLSKYVAHKKLVLPQLGAVGVSAHEVAKRTSYNVNYGPIRAKDIKEYINAGYKATKEMRTVHFNLWDRIVLTPMEIIPAMKKSLPILGGLFLANSFVAKPFDKTDATAVMGSIFSGAVLTPALLPHIPAKPFALKGWITGLGITAATLLFSGKFKKGNRLLSLGNLLLFPAVSSYIAMNFTGSSTYTSPSGVNKEMRKSLPFIVGAAAVGCVITLGVHLFGGRKRK